jgi:hypothetical protein
VRICAIPGGVEFGPLPCVGDGKERAFTLSDEKHSSHTVSCKFINECKLEITVNHDNGKMITTQLVTISADGKTMEQVWSGKSEDGSPINEYDRDEIFDRQ